MVTICCYYLFVDCFSVCGIGEGGNGGSTGRGFASLPLIPRVCLHTLVQQVVGGGAAVRDVVSDQPDDVTQPGDKNYRMLYRA